MRFSNETVSPREQFDAWVAAGAGLFDLAPLDPEGIRNGAGFPAHHTVWMLGPLVLLSGRTGGVRFSRSAARIRRDHCDHWAIGAWRSGANRGIAGELCYESRAGDLALYGFHQPLETERTPSEAIKLFIPRDAMADVAPALEANLARPLTSTLGRLLWIHLDGLARMLDTMPPQEAPAAAEATLALVRAAVTGGGADHVAAAAPQLREAVRARVMAIIRRNLGSARLTPDRLARLAGLSRTQLYRVFEPVGGVARVVQRERLRAIARALADPAEHRPIAQVAEAFGMPDASSFSRAFRREFGATPRAFREVALPGAARWPSGGHPHGGVMGADFAGLLRRLRG